MPPTSVIGASGSEPITQPPTSYDVRAAVIAIIPCKFSGYAVADDHQTLLIYASPLDDEAKAAIADAATRYPTIPVTAKEGVQPAAAAELQRTRVQSTFRDRISGAGIAIAADGRLKVDASVDTQQIADELRRDIEAAVADRSPIEQQIPFAAPALDITVGPPRFSPN